MFNSRVYNQDCMEGMKEFPDKYFELAIVDPPYGIGSAQMNMGSEKNTETFYKRKKWDDEKPTAEYFDVFFRVSKNQIVWGGNYFELRPSRCFLIWDKKIGSNDFSMCEFAWTSFRTGSKIYSMCGTHLTQGKRIHPTQKPVKLYRWLLKNYAKEGDKILDTHLGSQSSRIAAFDMGFDFTGYELDKDYFDAGNKRFEQHKSQLKLFV